MTRERSNARCFFIHRTFSGLSNLSAWVYNTDRDDFDGSGNFEYKVPAPCGVCQEMLFFWGEDVQCAVGDENQRHRFIRLKEMQPYYWRKAYVRK